MDGLTLGLTFGLAAAGAASGYIAYFYAALSNFMGGNPPKAGKFVAGGTVAGALLGLCIGGAVNYMSDYDMRDTAVSCVENMKDGQEAVISKDTQGNFACRYQ